MSGAWISCSTPAGSAKGFLPLCLTARFLDVASTVRWASEQNRGARASSTRLGPWAVADVDMLDGGLGGVGSGFVPAVRAPLLPRKRAVFSVGGAPPEAAGCSFRVAGSPPFELCHGVVSFVLYVWFCFMVFINLGELCVNPCGAYGFAGFPSRDVTSRHGDVTSRHGDVTSRHGDVTSRHGDATSRHGDATSRHRDATSRHGDATSRHGDATSRHGDVTSRQGDATSRHRDATSRCGDVASRCIDAIRRGVSGGIAPGAWIARRKSGGGYSLFAGRYFSDTRNASAAFSVSSKPAPLKNPCCWPS